MPRPEKFVSRADLGWSPLSPADYADPTQGLVVHYDGADQNLATLGHAACVAYWQSVRSYHTSVNGWADIGYSHGACPHGYVFEGRGLCRYQAAQGTTTGNSNYYSVTLMCGPTDTITPEQVNAVRQLREWLIEATGMGTAVLGHRDFVATLCPGDPLYGMVTSGVFAQPATWGEEKHMPDLREFAGSGVSNQALPASQFSCIEVAPGQYDLAYGGERGVLEAGLTLSMTGVPAGREVQVRFALYKQNSSGAWVYDRSLGLDAPVHDGGSMHLVRTGVVDVPAGRRVRLEATHFVTGPGVEVQVTSRYARVLYWA